MITPKTNSVCRIFKDKDLKKCVGGVRMIQIERNLYCIDGEYKYVFYGGWLYPMKETKEGSDFLRYMDIKREEWVLDLYALDGAEKGNVMKMIVRTSYNLYNMDILEKFKRKRFGIDELYSNKTVPYFSHEPL